MIALLSLRVKVWILRHKFQNSISIFNAFLKKKQVKTISNIQELLEGAHAILHITQKSALLFALRVGVSY